MKKAILSVALCGALFATAQDNLIKGVAANKSDNMGFKFTDGKIVKHTSIKDQANSGTCWSYAGASFLESEAMRLGKPELDLAEIFTARNVYAEKAKMYVRFHGDFSYGDGGQNHDVINMYKKYGVVPQEVYTGLNYGTKRNNFDEMQDGLKAFLDGIVKQNKLTPNWQKAFTAAMDSYLGEIPETFTYKGKKYTPQTYAKEFVGINPDDYIEVTSMEYMPKYTGVIVPVQDNWSMDKAYNVNPEDLVTIVDNALSKGYTVLWGTDVSEKYFSWKNGVAFVPEKDYADMTDNERKTLFDNPPAKERVITQEMRRIAFDNWETTDDHSMHIVGTAKDQNGRDYYKVKNSWADKNDQKGYLYVTKPFLQYKTLTILIHKDAIPTNILKNYKK